MFIRIFDFKRRLRGILVTHNFQNHNVVEIFSGTPNSSLDTFKYFIAYRAWDKG